MKMVRIFLIVLLISTLSPIVKGNSDTNRIVNYSQVPDIENYVRIGLELLHIHTINVVINNLNNDVKKSFQNDIELEGYVSKLEGGYIIHVINGLSKRDLISMLSHELIHIKQYETNELIIIKNTVIWQGHDLTALTKTEYETRPWEIEAYNNEESIRIQLKKVK